MTSSSYLESGVELFFPLLLRGYREQSYLVRVGEFLLLTYLTWRFWRFTLSPMLYPNDPREFPYWIPCKNLLRSSSSMTVNIFLVFGWHYLSK
jgi:hypothetical protein